VAYRAGGGAGGKELGAWLSGKAVRGAGPWRWAGLRPASSRSAQRSMGKFPGWTRLHSRCVCVCVCAGGRGSTDPISHKEKGAQ
jgi:hypothetical protein